MDKLVKTLKGAVRSKTMWASLFVALLPYADFILPIATGISPLMGTLIGGAFAYFRFTTTKALADKVAAK